MKEDSKTATSIQHSTGVSMVNMAETEPMFLVGGRLPVNGAETASEDSDGEPPILFTAKRNKRKNFQPRNISYQETEEEENALDLSEPKRARRSDDLAPMDLSKGGSERRKETSESDSSDGESRPPYLLHQAFLHQPQEASDLREYAEKTVNELLAIYGLNSAEVAESITNNVPISNFSSGKILESLRRGPIPPRSPGGSQPPTPPKSPHSPLKPKDHQQQNQQGNKTQSQHQQTNNYTPPRVSIFIIII